jgi:hypothetical protein
MIALRVLSEEKRGRVDRRRKMKEIRQENENYQEEARRNWIGLWKVCHHVFS